MGCCGQEKITTMIHIAQGVAMATLDSVFTLPKDRYSYVNDRLNICSTCPKITFMHKSEYLEWLRQNKIEVLKHIEDLSVLPELEIQQFEVGKTFFCAICKCWLPAKAYVKDEQCPLKNWSDENEV
jgi:hypothetical protein